MTELADPASAAASVLFRRLRSLSVEASTVRTSEEVRDRLLFAVLVATEAVAGTFALIDGDHLEVFSASGYQPEALAPYRRFSLHSAVPLAEAARTGETVLLSDAAAIADRYPDLERPGERPAVAIPLVAGSGRIGALGLSFNSPQKFDEVQVEFLSAVAAQVATAMDRVGEQIEAQQVRDRHRAVSQVLRASLLPARVPTIRGWEVAASYHAAEGDLGGDFYDFIPLSSGGWAIVIGDVQGRGTDAAIVSALARQTLRDATAAFDSPAAMLAHLNTALLAGLQGVPTTDGHPLAGDMAEPGVDAPRFVTVAALTLGPGVGGAREVRLALAGHPQPLHGRAATGRVEAVGVPGGLLGFLAGPPLTTVTARVEPGDVIVLFTDGLVERHHSSRFFDESAVAPIIAAHLSRPAEEIARAVVSAADDFAGALHSDDTAVVVLKLEP